LARNKESKVKGFMVNSLWRRFFQIYSWLWRLSNSDI